MHTYEFWVLINLIILQLFGALWYRLAVQRQIDCWKRHCDILLGPHCHSKRSHDFYCEDRSPIIGNLSKWDELCPVKEADPEVFDFGIYLYALQSNVTGSTNVARRMSQSFWWALRNLRFAQLSYLRKKPKKKKQTDTQINHTLINRMVLISKEFHLWLAH